MYTLDRLKNENELSDNCHPLTGKDLQLANIYKLAIEASRSSIAPKPGDVLIKKDGKQYHIDEVENEFLKKGKITVVENAYVPFTRLKIADDSIKISLSTSGGPFTGVDRDKIKNTGLQQLATFGFFGSCGACANGQRTIKALVNIWEEA
jgi:hypothetical protein